MSVCLKIVEVVQDTIALDKADGEKERFYFRAVVPKVVRGTVVNFIKPVAVMIVTEE